jgi:hypothetical protein
MQEKLEILQQLLDKVTKDPSLKDIDLKKSISAAGFQIRAVDAVPSALWGNVHFDVFSNNCLQLLCGIGKIRRIV